MTDPAAAVQKAVYEALQSISADVYDYVNQETEYPYVVIDTQGSMNDDPLDSRRDERYMLLSVWSRYKGQKEVLDIMTEIDTALHNKSLPMDTGTMVICRVLDKDTTRDSDNETFMGRVKLRIVTEH